MRISLTRILLTWYANLVPSHALRHGRAARSRRLASRRRNLRHWAPVTVAMATAVTVVNPFSGNIASQAGRALLGGAVAGILMAGLVLLDACAQRPSARCTRTRRRWQYAMFRLGYGILAGVGVLVILHYRQVLLANVAGALVMWSSAIALVMLDVRRGLRRLAGASAASQGAR
jgi:hypothetical protein